MMMIMMLGIIRIAPRSFLLLLDTLALFGNRHKSASVSILLFIFIGKLFDFDYIFRLDFVSFDLGYLKMLL